MFSYAIDLFFFRKGYEKNSDVNLLLQWKGEGRKLLIHDRAKHHYTIIARRRKNSNRFCYTIMPR
jgi:hypothetical protein